MGAKTYWVGDENDFLHDKPFRKLERAQALAAKAAEECSWKCLTPPAPDNEMSHGKGNFRCGTMSAHGIHIRETADGYWGEEHDVPDETFMQVKAGPHVDWTLEVVIDRGTDYAADGEDTLYFTGPEQTDTGWDAVLDGVADGDEVIEATVRATPFGRYHHLDGEQDDYPMRWRKGYGF
jgi:hypothetical protein